MAMQVASPVRFFNFNLCLERDLCKGQKTENFPQLKGYISGQRMKFKNRPEEATRIAVSYKPLTHMPLYIQ